MTTTIAPTDSHEATREAIRQAVELLQASEIVALPTETVYGLAANAFDEVAVAKIFATKHRPCFDPLIVHLASAEDLPRVAALPKEIAHAVGRVAAELWPGPLTLILPKTQAVPDLVTAGLPTVAVRVSAHPIFARVARTLGQPLAAPSANRFGRISPTSAAGVMSELGGLIPLIVDGGACHHGLESTIIRIEPGDKTKPHFHLLRPGPITREELREFGKVILPKKGASGQHSFPQAPGQCASHYAPATPLRLIEDPAQFHPEPGKSYALLSFRGDPKDGFVDLHPWKQVAVLSPGTGRLAEAAVRFFFVLRQLDESGADEIIAEPMSEAGLGLAMMDRLRRASVRAW
jgi:L-threonylcarbamoyladenylate synthase